MRKRCSRDGAASGEPRAEYARVCPASFALGFGAVEGDVEREAVESNAASYRGSLR